MAELAQTAALSALAGVERDRSYFWRRLHSLTGIVPVGLFLLFHLFENLSAISGEHAYNGAIAHLASLLPSPYFYAVELAVVILPIAYHGLYGTFVALQARPNAASYGYRRNVLYLLQRVSGILALIYIAYHVAALRVGITLVHAGGKVPGFSGIEGNPGYVSFGDMVQHYANPVVLGWYVVGTLACAFHFANGLNGLCWTWGLTVSERSRRVVEAVSWAVFVALAVPFLHILYTFWLTAHPVS